MDEHVTAEKEPWRYTQHCRRRAAERGITLGQIDRVLTEPEISYAQTTYGPHRQVRQRGELAVVVNTATRTVITVLFRDQARRTEQSSPTPGWAA